MTLSASQKAKAVSNLRSLNEFFPHSQKQALFEFLNGEEGDFFASLIADFKTRIDAMPVTYEQDGKGDDAIAYLHYFVGGHDFYITEKDMDDGGTIQAFGLTATRHGVSLGYISIAYLSGHHEHFDPDHLPDADNFPCIEMDLYFEPTPIGEIKKKLMAA